RRARNGSSAAASGYLRIRRKLNDERGQLLQSDPAVRYPVRWGDSGIGAERPHSCSDRPSRLKSQVQPSASNCEPDRVKYPGQTLKPWLVWNDSDDGRQILHNRLVQQILGGIIERSALVLLLTTLPKHLQPISRLAEPGHSLSLTHAAVATQAPASLWHRIVCPASG